VRSPAGADRRAGAGQAAHRRTCFHDAV